MLLLAVGIPTLNNLLPPHLAHATTWDGLQHCCTLVPIGYGSLYARLRLSYVCGLHKKFVYRLNMVWTDKWISPSYLVTHFTVLDIWLVRSVDSLFTPIFNAVDVPFLTIFFFLILLFLYCVAFLPTHYYPLFAHHRYTATVF